MDGLTIFGIFLVLWGLATLAVAVFKPKNIWELGKIRGFVELLGDKGAAIFFSVVGLAALGGGVWILI